MELTDKEMKLNNLEYSETYCGVMVGEIVLFRLNSNINNAQSEILYKEIIRRINAFEKNGLVDTLRAALEAAEKEFEQRYHAQEGSAIDKLVLKIVKVAIAKVT